MLQTELTMRAKPHEFEGVRIRQPINQHQIGSDVTVAKILPRPGQWVIEVTTRQRLVGGQ